MMELLATAFIIYYLYSMLICVFTANSYISDDAMDDFFGLVIYTILLVFILHPFYFLPKYVLVEIYRYLIKWKLHNTIKTISENVKYSNKNN
jgi:hypothetical protein